MTCKSLSLPWWWHEQGRMHNPTNFCLVKACIWKVKGQRTNITGFLFFLSFILPTVPWILTSDSHTKALMQVAIAFIFRTFITYKVNVNLLILSFFHLLQNMKATELRFRHYFLLVEQGCYNLQTSQIVTFFESLFR